MPQSSWEDTRLFAELKDAKRAKREPESDSIAAWLKTVMPSIEQVLRSGGTSPTDFTLHNDEHGFRVAQLMVEVTSPKTLQLLTTYELAHLLLSAYLHDIGMTPAQHRVDRLMRLALGGESGSTDDEDAREFKEWLETSSQFASLNPSQASCTEGARYTWAKTCVAYFCRLKHNDWSEEWINTNLAAPPSSQGLYPAFLEDLVTLCRSHHEGYAELCEQRFDPRIVAHNRIVHQRYLACVLRIADVCEVDPERTPPAIFAHRDIGPSSVPFWHKDQQLTIEVTETSVRLVAYPRRAVFHRAIEETADQIEDELRVCGRLATEKPFTSFPFHGVTAPHYDWKLKPYLYRTITPRAGAYEYIDGSFRPNTDKVLHLLGSEELYSTPIAAVRELLQNAFDAVLERIAHEWLAQPDASANAYLDLQSSRHVSVEFLSLDGSYHLRCTDDGAGMNKSIIRDHLLVSGMSKRRDIELLERRCHERGRQVGRTGKFGIGVLSYFLLASELTFDTRRLPTTGDDDGTGWKFTTAGVGNFGELVRSQRLETGSTVDLRLRDGVVKDPVLWWNSLREYTLGTVTRTPCHFTLSSSISECRDSVQFSPGWIRNPRQLTDEVMGNAMEPNSEKEEELGDLFFDEVAGKKRHKRLQGIARAKEDIKARMRWSTGNETEVEGVGRVRIHIPYFELSGGMSPVYLDAHVNGDRVVIAPIPHGWSGHENVDCLRVAGDLLLSWKGMSVEARRVERQSHVIIVSGGISYGAIVEIDLESESVGRLGLSREWVQLAKEDSPWSLYELVKPRIAQEGNRVSEAIAGSTFESLGYAYLRDQQCPDDSLYWLRNECQRTSSGVEFVWEKVHFPLTRFSHVWSGRNGERRIRLAGEPITTYNDVSCFDVDGSSGLGRFLPRAPSRLAGFDLGSGGVFIVPIWDAAGSNCAAVSPRDPLCRFPAEWRSWVAVQTEGAGRVWNREHPSLTEVNWNTVANLRRNSVWKEPKGNIDQVRERCEETAFSLVVLLEIVRNRELDRWNGIVAKDSALADLLWRSLKGEKSLEFIWQAVEKDGMIKNSRMEFTRRGAKVEEGFVIPQPSAEWMAIGEPAKAE